MRIVERELIVPAPSASSPLAEVRRAVEERLPPGSVPVRFAVAASDDSGWQCEVGVIEDAEPSRRAAVRSIFDLRRRDAEDAAAFTVVLVVPTGVGCEIGGHAGDAMPVATLLASVSDTLVTHPNVVNGSDIMELPANAHYVEGSVVARLLAGTAGLRPVRANRVLAVVEQHEMQRYRDAAVNSVSAARVAFGLQVPEAVALDPPVMVRSRFTSSGRAVGEISEMGGLLDVLDAGRGSYDAVAISTRIEVPFEYHLDYYTARGAMVNPWGGAEAILTHAVSSLYDVPAAHAPMLESKAVEDLQLGVVDPRMAAEAISTAFYVCVLKGLQRSPRIVPLDQPAPRGVIGAEQVSCLVVPDGALGLPTLAALEQGIPVVAVRENRNVLRNDLTRLPWQPGQLHVVENYWEAAAVVASLRIGIDPAVVRRPIADTRLVGLATEERHLAPAAWTPSSDGGRPPGAP